MECKSWKSQLIWAICAIFSSLQVTIQEKAAIENWEVAGGKKR